MADFAVFPVIMVVFCILMMLGKMGCMMGGHGTQGEDGPHKCASGSSMDILDRRYVLGEIDREEYEEKEESLNRAINHSDKEA